MIAHDATATATAVAGMLRDERYADLEAMFAPPLRAAVSAETTRIAWETEIQRTGPVTGIGEPVVAQAREGLVRARVAVTCAHGGLTVVMSVDGAGALHGLRLAALEGVTPWAPPAYVKVKAFDERDVTVDAGRLAVGGTLSMPRGRGPRPGVVLLPPMGPMDRDETSGLNKPLKDIAWGLASRGVAVLRFDMAAYAHGEQAPSSRDLTMKDEYTPYAVAAVHLLRRELGVDPARIFLLGHSMGGKVAPRVAAAEPSIAGLVILAGDTEPMQRSAIRVARYLARLNPGLASEAAVETLTRQAALVESSNLSVSTPASELPFGLSGAYWLDMRSYDPVAVAAALDKPMFILQGGRDYQVTVEDDLAGWRRGLQGRPDVTIRVYNADNHLFFRGSGPSTPAEYEPAQHVDPAVVADIASWLRPRQGMFARLVSGPQTSTGRRP